MIELRIPEILVFRRVVSVRGAETDRKTKRLVIRSGIDKIHRARASVSRQVYRIAIQRLIVVSTCILEFRIPVIYFIEIEKLIDRHTVHPQFSNEARVISVLTKDPGIRFIKMRIAHVGNLKCVSVRALV